MATSKKASKKTKQPKFVQIAAGTETRMGETDHTLYALDANGDVWALNADADGWEQMITNRNVED